MKDADKGGDWVGYAGTLYYLLSCSGNLQLFSSKKLIKESFFCSQRERTLVGDHSKDLTELAASVISQNFGLLCQGPADEE